MMMPNNSYLLLSILAILSISISQINAQDPGDTVTYTQAGIVYQGVIDPNYDTTSTVEIGPATATAAAEDPNANAAHGGGGALGGGAGIATTSLQSLQVISGYTPPPSLDLPAPTVSAGSIASLTQISGYASLLASQQSRSGAIPLSVPSKYASLTGAAFTLAAVLGAAGTLLL